MREMRSGVLAGLLMVQAASGAGPETAALDGFSGARIRAHVEFLASDLLEGREAGTRGYDLAALYVATELKSLGLEPAGDAGGYLQQVPLLESSLESGELTITRPGGAPLPIATPDEALVLPQSSRETSEVTAPVVFAGFGVVAPEYGHDDYAGLDVEGRIVLIMTNAPASFPGEPRAYYSSNEQKARFAAERGAIGALVMASPDDARRNPWERTRQYIGRPTITWVGPDGTPGGVEPRLRGAAYLGPAAVEKLFAGSPVPLADVEQAAEAGTPRSFTLPVTATIRAKTSHRRTTSANVAGLLRGADPALRDTSVVLTAHLDHVGIGREVDGDRIYNGAYDNAAGSAIMLEVARAFARRAEAPKRSVLFVFVTAEEKGLVGSSYFARHPGAAAGRLVANVNLDMPVFQTAFTDVIAFGAGNSSLDAVVEQAAAALGLKVSPDPMPQENIFVRSDQYSFVKEGVPAVYLMPGFTARDASVNGSELFGAFLRSRYHQPGDDLSQPMDLEAAAVFARVNYLVAEAIADAATPPAWKPGNFFGETFSRD